MKLKRVLAGIIACTLVATAMGATAFAADTEPTDIVTTTEVEVLRGDINNNGKVTIEDALILSRYLVSGDSAAKAAFAELMELNLDAVREENGQIGILAIIDILKEVVKRTPVETTTPETSETTVSEEETTVSEEETTVSEEETTVSEEETTVSEEETTVSEEETTVETEDPELVESALADLAAAIEIAEVERLNEEYTEDSWLALEDALAAAKEIGEDATIAEIVAATEALTAAINALVTAEDLLAQKLEDLAALVATAEDKIAAEDEANPYDADSFNVLSDAIYDAKNVIMFSGQTLEEVTIAFDELTSALAGLKTQAQVVKEAGVVLKADIVIAKKYASTSTEDLNAAITDAEALYSRTGNIIAGKTIADIDAATTAIKTSLEAIINDAWAAIPTDKDNAEDTYDALAYALIDAGYFSYEDIFTAAGLTLDEAAAADLEEILAGEDADAVATAVEEFYAEILADIADSKVSIAGFDTIKELDAVFQAFKTKTYAAAATAKADAKKAYDSASALGTKTDLYEATSLEALNEFLTDNQGAYVDLSIDIAAGTANISKVSALAFKAEIAERVNALVSLEDKKAQDAATALLAKLDPEESGMYADMIEISEAGKLTFIDEYKSTIKPGDQATYLIAMQQAYDVLNGEDQTAATLNSAITKLSTNLLAAKKTYLNAIAAGMPVNTYTTAIKSKVTSSTFITEANVNDSIAIVEAIITGDALTEFVTGVAITGASTKTLTVTLSNGVTLTISGVKVDEDGSVAYPTASGANEILTALLGSEAAVIDAALASVIAEAEVLVSDDYTTGSWDIMQAKLVAATGDGEEGEEGYVPAPSTDSEKAIAAANLAKAIATLVKA